MCGTILSAGICAYFLILTATIAEQQQCDVAKLPAFGDRRDDPGRIYLGRPPDDRLQAIVPAYTFNCTGRVTEWRACVDHGGMGRYYIRFQVWRPTGVPGCYRLVWYNAPPPPNFVESDEVDNAGQLLRPQSDHCVNLPVNEDEQIEFQPGDVIGYYADQFVKDGDDRDNGGIQVVRDQDVVVYHRIDVPLSDLQTQYAIPALGPDLSSCGFDLNGSESTLFQMTSSTDGAPIISLSLTVVVISGIESSSVLFSTAIIPTSSPSLLTSTSSVSVNDCGGGSGGFSPSPSPSVIGEGEGSGGGEGVAVAVLLVIAVMVIVIALSILVLVIMCKRAKRNHFRNLTNPSYDSTVLSTLKWTSHGKHSPTLSSSAPYHNRHINLFLVKKLL